MSIPRFQFPEDPPHAGRRAFLLRAPPLLLRAPRRASSQFQFSLGTLLLVTTLVSACLAVSVASPLLGIPINFIALLAFGRTSITNHLYREVNVPFDLEMQLWEFVVSCSLIVIALVTGAFCAILVAMVAGTISIGMAGISPAASTLSSIATALLSTGAGGFVFTRVLWLTRPQ